MMDILTGNELLSGATVYLAAEDVPDALMAQTDAERRDLDRRQR